MVTADQESEEDDEEDIDFEDEDFEGEWIISLYFLFTRNYSISKQWFSTALVSLL